MAQDHSVLGLRLLFFCPPAPTLQNGVYNDCVVDSDGLTFFWVGGGALFLVLDTCSQNKAKIYVSHHKL